MPKETIDFKTGEPVATENGQSVKEETTKEETPKVESEKEEVVKTEEVVETPKEDIETLPDWAKEKFAKLESDKENYKKGLLKYKKFTLTPEEKKTEVKEEEYPDWDEASKKFQKQTLSEAEKKAEAKAKSIVEGYNEKAAISQFLEKNPDAQDKWDDIVSNYSSKNGKETIDSVIKDLQRAYVLTRYESGDIDKIQKEALEKGIKAGTAKAKIAELSSVSKTTSKTTQEGNSLSKSALEMAKKLRVDPKELAKEDDSPIASVNF